MAVKPSAGDDVSTPLRAIACELSEVESAKPLTAEQWVSIFQLILELLRVLGVIKAKTE